MRVATLEVQTFSCISTACKLNLWESNCLLVSIGNFPCSSSLSRQAESCRSADRSPWWKRWITELAVGPKMHLPARISGVSFFSGEYQPIQWRLDFSGWGFERIKIWRCLFGASEISLIVDQLDQLLIAEILNELEGVFLIPLQKHRWKTIGGDEHVHEAW